MRSLSLLVACSALLFASCDDDEATAPKEESKYPSHRDIPTSLRSKCPDMTPASRMAGETPYGPAVPLEQNQTTHITYGIYDTTGTLVSQGEQNLVLLQPGYPIDISWRGRDSNGNPMPTGVYFVFLDVYDQAGMLLQSSSDCIGFRAAS